MKKTLALFLSTLLCTLGSSAFAADATWSNTSGGTWSGTSNWTAGVVAGGTDATANFSTLNITADATVTLGAPVTIGSLLFGDTTPSNNWIVSGSALTLAVTSGAPTVQVNNQAVTFNSALTGTQGLTKTGAGMMLVNSTASSLTGPITVSAGTLAGGGNVNAFGGITGDITVAAGAGFGFNNINNFNQSTYANNLFLSGTGSSASFGALELGGNVTASGTITLNADARITHNWNIGTINGPIVGSNKSLTLATFVSSQYGIYANGNISLGSGALIVNGIGTVNTEDVLLSGSNSYSGGTQVNSGALYISSTNALPGWSTGAFRIASGASLVVANALNDSNVATLLSSGTFAAGANFGFNTGASDRTYSANIANTAGGALGIVKWGGNTLTLSGSNTYSGPTLVNAGTLKAGSANAFSTGTLGGIGGTIDLNGNNISASALALNGLGSIVATGGGTLTLNGPIIKSANSGTPVVSAAIDLGGGNRVVSLQDTAGFLAELTLSGSIGNGALTLNNAASGYNGFGTLYLTGTNNYAGGTTITSGALSVNNGSALGSGTVTIGTDGSLLFGGQGIANVTGVTLSNPLVVNRTYGGGWNLAIQNYSGANTLSGPVNLQSATTPVVVTAGTLAMSGAISGAGGLDTAGAGVLFLSGSNSYSGGNNVISGTLKLGNASALGASTGALSVTSYLDLNGYSQTVGTLAGSGTIGNNSGSGTSILTIGGIAGGTFSGVINNNLGSVGGTTGLTISSPLNLVNTNNTWSGATQVLSGSSSFTGPTTVNSATLQLNGASGFLAGTGTVTVTGNGSLIDGDTATAANNSNKTNRINPNAALVLGGSTGAGTLSMPFGATGTTSQTFASITVNAGQNVVTTANTAAGTNNLIFTGASGAGYLRSTNGLLNVGAASGFNPQFTNAPTAVGGSSVSGAAGSGNEILIGAILAANDFVKAASGNLVAATYAASGASSLTADANINLTGANTTLAGSTVLSINSLKFSDNAARTLNLGANSQLTIASGGILTSSAVATTGNTITSGSLTSGQSDLWICANGTALNNPRNGSAALTIASQIYGGISLTVGGAQNVVLTNTANNYSGGTYLSGGSLQVNADSTLGALSGTVTALSGWNALTPTASFTFGSSRNFVINSGATLLIGDQGQTNTIAGKISGGGLLQIGYVSANQRVLLTNTNSGFTGTYDINGHLRADEGVGLSSNANLLFNGRFFANLGLLETSGTFTRSLGTGAGQVQWMNDGQYGSGGFSAVGGPLVVNLGGNATPSQVTWGSGYFLTSGGNLFQLQNANSTASVTFQNPIALNGGIRSISANNATYPGILSGVISGNSSSGITTAATGLLVLSGSNTYLGKTTIPIGTISVASLNSVTGGSTSSNLGAPTTVPNGTIDLGAIGAGGPNNAGLTYTGTGETTDRVLNMLATIGQITLTQAGTGLLKFTSNLTSVAVRPTTATAALILDGSTSGTGEISGAITDTTYTATVDAAASGTNKLSVSTGPSASYGWQQTKVLVSGSGIAPGSYWTAFSGTIGTLNNSTTAPISAGQQITLTGVNGVTKNGTGKWILSGTNTYSGVTTISAGTLQFARTAALYNSGTASWTNTNIIVQSGATLALNVGGTNEFATGDVTTLLGNLGGLGGAVNNNGLRSGATIGFDTNNASGGTFTVADKIANSTSTGGGAIGLTKLGAGTLLLTGSNTYTGTTTVNGGLLSAGNASAFGASGPLVLNSGTVNLGGYSMTLAALSGSAGTQITTGSAAGTATLTAANASGTSSFAGVIADNVSGQIAFTKTGAGTLVLSGSNTYSGATTISAGVLLFPKTAALYNSGTASWTAANLTVASGATLALNVGGSGEFQTGDVTTLLTNLGGLGGAVNNNGLKSGAILALDTTNASGGTFTVADNLSNSTGTGGGAIALTKLGTGTLVMAGNNNYTGSTTVSAGTLSLTGSNNFNTSTGNITVGGGGGYSKLSISGVTTTATNSTMAVGTAANDRSVLDISTNASFKFLQLGNSSAAGALNITSGTVQQTGGAGVYNFNVGLSGYGYLRMTGGSLSASEFDLVTNSGNGVVDLLGGTITATNYALLNRVASAGAGNSLLNIAGGTLNSLGTNASAWGGGGTSIYNIGAGGLYNMGNTALTLNNSTSNSPVSLVTLASGTMITNMVKSNGSTAILNFNGGTLKAGGANATFITGLTGAYVHSGGGTIDNNGYAITIGQNLLAGTGTGLSSISVSNAGSGYIGAPFVQITGGGGSGATAVAQFDPVTGTVTGITVTSPGTGYTSTPTITLVGGGALSTGSATAATAAITSGGLTFQGSATTTLTGATNTYTGQTTVNGGVLAAGIANAFGSSAPLALNSGTVNLGGFSQAVGALSGSAGTKITTSSAAGTATLTSSFASGTSTFAGNIADNGSGKIAFTKSGAGTQVLSGSNSYSGATTVSAGQLSVNGSYTGAAAGSQLIVNSGTASFDMGSGSALFYGDGYNSASRVGVYGAYNGQLTLQSGTLSFLTQTAGTKGSLLVGGNAAGATGTVTVNGGTLTVDGRLLMAPNDPTSQGTLTINGGQVSLGVPGSYTTSGDPACGVLWFEQGKNIVNLNGGTLSLFGMRINVNAAVGSAFNFNGGTLKAVADNNTDFVNLAANMPAYVKSGGAIIDDGGFSVTISKPLLDGTGGGGLTKSGSGTLTLSNSNTYTGATIVNAGKLLVSGSLSGSTNLSVAVGATLELKTALVNTSGTLTVNGGTLVTNGGSSSAGTVALNNGSTFQATISGTTAGSHSQLTVTGSGNLSLTGSVTLAINSTGYTTPHFVLGDLSQSDRFALTIGGYSSGSSGTFANVVSNADTNYPGLSAPTFVDASNHAWAVYYGVDWAQFSTGNYAATGNDIALLAIPEPSVVASLVSGLGMLLFLQRRRRK